MPEDPQKVVSPPEVLVIAGFLGVHARLEAELSGIDQQFPLSRSHRSVIMSLGVSRRLGWLSKELGVSPPAITAIADGLVEKGLVLRVADPVDRRATCLVLTDQGKVALASLLAASARIVRDVTGLGDPDIKLLAEIFTRMRFENPRILETDAS